jgi:O-antigen/teichoic acid export membrane protein
MANLKSLAKDTAIYGLSSIIGRFLNYLLVPLYTYVINASSGGYGVVTNLYAYTALLLVILTYGMETTFFRFANKEGEDPDKVYSTILTSVLTTSALFVLLVVAFIPWVWYLFAANHSYLHNWFTFRAQAVSVAAILLALMQLVDWNKLNTKH